MHKISRIGIHMIVEKNYKGYLEPEGRLRDAKEGRNT